MGILTYPIMGSHQPGDALQVVGNVVASTPISDNEEEAFVPTDKFEGNRTGYVWMGRLGLGYYKDKQPNANPSDGVTKDGIGRYHSEIWIPVGARRKQCHKHLGMFDTVEEASSAYAEEYERIHGALPPEVPTEVHSIRKSKWDEHLEEEDHAAKPYQDRYYSKPFDAIVKGEQVAGKKQTHDGGSKKPQAATTECWNGLTHDILGECIAPHLGTSLPGAVAVNRKWYAGMRDSFIWAQYSAFKARRDHSQLARQEDVEWLWHTTLPPPVSTTEKKPKGWRAWLATITGDQQETTHLESQHWARLTAERAYVEDVVLKVQQYYPSFSAPLCCLLASKPVREVSVRLHACVGLQRPVGGLTLLELIHAQEDPDRTNDPLGNMGPRRFSMKGCLIKFQDGSAIHGHESFRGYRCQPGAMEYRPKDGHPNEPETFITNDDPIASWKQYQECAEALLLTHKFVMEKTN